MPIQKIPYAHRFGIISTSYKEKIEKEIQRQQHESDQSSSAYSVDHNKCVLFQLDTSFISIQFFFLY